MPVSNDDFIAFLLIGSWSRATGRRLRAAVPELSESELIEFWADDHLWPPPAWDDQRAASVRGNRS
jgi:hypothetical protein